jgi:hypothetical protein
MPDSRTWLTLSLLVLSVAPKTGFAQTPQIRTPIDCAASKVQAVGQTNCFVGPLRGASAGGTSTCTYQTGFVIGKMGEFDYTLAHTGYAGDPQSSDYMKCYMNRGDASERLRRADAEVLPGENWSALRGDDINFVADLSLSGRRCIAFVRRGPSWVAGSKYELSGHLCGQRGKAPNDPEVARLIGSARFPQ